MNFHPSDTNRPRALLPERILFWLRFLLFPLLAVAAYPGLILEWGGDHWLVRAAWVGLLSYCWFCIGGSFHESVHQTLFSHARANLWFGRALGTLMLIPYTTYRESHRRHHAYLNTPADYELWPYSDPRCTLTFRRAFVWLDLFAGIAAAPYIYGRIFFHNDSRLSLKTRRTIGREYVALAGVWGIAIAALLLATQRAGWSCREFDPVWLLPLVIAPMINTGRKFVEHLGMSSTDPVLGTRTILAANPLARVCSFFNFDIAIHGPHHRHPRAPHVELASRLEAYRQSHPDQAIPLFGSYAAALVHLGPSLWKNPACGNATLLPPGSTGPGSRQQLDTVETVADPAFDDSETWESSAVPAC